MSTWTPDNDESNKGGTAVYTPPRRRATDNPFDLTGTFRVEHDRRPDQKDEAANELVRAAGTSNGKSFGGWVDVLFTLINALFKIKKPNGQRYDMSDFRMASDGFFGAKREASPADLNSWEKGAGRPKLIQSTTASPAASAGGTTGGAATTQTKESTTPPQQDHYASITGLKIVGEQYVFSGRDETANCDVTITKSGGSAGWRANNPGLIKQADLAELVKGSGGAEDDFKKTFGVLGVGENDLLVFKDMAHGLFADLHRMQKDYGSMTVADAIAELAQGTENDNYFKEFTAALANASADKKITELSPAEFGQFARVAAHIKGLKEGVLELKTANGNALSSEAREQILRDQGANLLDPTKIRPGNTPVPEQTTTPAPAAQKPTL